MGLFSFVSGAVDRLVGNAIDTRMRQAGEAGVLVARELVPKRTGYLDSTIGYTYDQQRKNLIVHADAKYAAAVEEGTIHMRAQPYLRPALNAIGRIWGGDTQISYPNAYALSGRKGSPEIAEFNRRTSERLHRGASGRAKVRYQHNAPVRQSRTRFRMTLNHPSPNDPTTPIL